MSPKQLDFLASFLLLVLSCSYRIQQTFEGSGLRKYNKLLKYAAKNAAGQLLAGFANNTRNCPLAERYTSKDGL
jgi:hypothetical protein